MVPEEEAAMWEASAGAGTRFSREEGHQYALQAAEEAYYAALEELGMLNEYAGFPGIEGYDQGPFNPAVEE